jgi:two-component system, chemotaxis family, chemotaxis protein CheY
VIERESGRPSVLVAEDDSVFRRVICFTLTRAGFDVQAAADGQQAWDLLQQGMFDGLVTDHQMPRMSGIELLEQVRANPSLAELQIVLCTAKGLELDSEFLSNRYGLAAVMHKPFSPRKLGEVLEVCCKSARKV